MSTVSLDVFLPELTPKLLGCPEPVIKNALRTAAAEFCTRSRCWQERLPAVAVTIGSFPYSIPTAAHATLSRVLVAHVDASKLEPTNYDVLDQSYDWDTRQGTPTHYLLEADGSLVVFPLPAVSSQLRLTVAYTVNRSAELLEAFLYERYRDELVHGAMKLLVAMPGKGWSRPEDAAMHIAKFEQGVQAARVETLNNIRAPGDLRVAPRPFA